MDKKIHAQTHGEMLSGKFVLMPLLKRVMGHLEDYALEIGFDSDLLDDTEALRNIIELPT